MRRLGSPEAEAERAATVVAPLWPTEVETSMLAAVTSLKLGTKVKGNHKMKAIVLYGRHDMRCEEMPIPKATRE